MNNPTQNMTSTLNLDRRTITILGCFLFFSTFLLIADITSVKLLQADFFGYLIIVPAGTIAFAFTFVCVDVAIELSDRRIAYILLVQTLVIRALALVYFQWAVGDASGSTVGFDIPVFWDQQSQSSYAFVLEGTTPIYVAGFAAIIAGFIVDIYIYSRLRDAQRGKNTFWIRNIVSTVLGQAVNSIFFVIIAFAAVLTGPELISAVVGQMIVKGILAIVDPAFALTIRNWGEGRSQWYAIWKRNLRVDYENYQRP